MLDKPWLDKLTQMSIFFNLWINNTARCVLIDLGVRDVRDQFLHVETETETQCTQSQFLILRLRL